VCESLIGISRDEQATRPIEFKRRVVVFAEIKKHIPGPSTSHVFSLRERICWARDDRVGGIEAGAAVCRVNFMVKLLRAHGGCLGRSRR
jgi:hypothetical protein